MIDNEDQFVLVKILNLIKLWSWPIFIKKRIDII